MVVGHDEEKKMLILMNADGTMCAGIFEFHFQIRKTADGMVMILPPDDSILEPIGTFFKQTRPAAPSTISVDGCVVGHELYLFPDEREQDCDVFEWDDEDPQPPIPDRIRSCKFDLINRTEELLPNFSLARKIMPLMVAVHDGIYVLSFPDYCNTKTFREPCFELLNTRSYEWSPLPCSPVHTKFYRISGYAVLQDQSLILVCLTLLHTWEVFFYSYNVQTGKWKTVNNPTEGRGSELYDCVVNEEAVVIGNNIYTYDSGQPGGLKVFSYTDVSNAEEEEGDLILGSVRVVEGLEIDRKYPEDYYCLYPDDSFALAKVEDRILCVLNTLYQDFNLVLHVCVSFIQLEYEGDCCTTLKSFMCPLHTGRVLSDPIIKSCFVLGPNVTSCQSEEASRFA